MLENVSTAPRRTRSALRGRPRPALLAVMSLLLAGGSLLPTAPAHADTGNGLLLWYPLNESSGTVADDSSGHGNNGTVAGTASWGGEQGLSFDGTDTYIQVPNNIMAGLSSITVSFDTWIDPSQASPYYLYGFGNTSGPYGNGYLFTSGNQFRAAITAGDYTGEQTTSAGTALPTGTWTHVTYTQTGTTGTLYKDGVQIAQNTNVTVTPGQIGNGVTASDFIGRSLFASDNYFKGKMRDFRVYDHALDAGQVQADAGAHWEEIRELAGYNGALTAYEDPKTGPVIIFPSDYTGDINNLQHPSGWTDSTGATPTSWPTPTTAKSAMFTQDQLNNVQNAVANAIQPNGDTTYSLADTYDGASDRVIVQTNAPSSVTDPLAAQYPNQVVIQGPPVNNAPATCPVQTSLTANPAGNAGGATAASEQLQAMADFNCALSAYQDPAAGPVIVFPSDYTGDIHNLQIPQDWSDSKGYTPTSWPTPTTVRSVQFTAAKVQEIVAAAVAQIEPAGSTIYHVAAHYDGMSDRIVVDTDAPASVTDPLVAAYPNQVTIAGQTAPAMQIVNKNSNLDLGIDSASTTDGGAVVQQTADATANQQWRLIPAGNGQYKIQDVNSGLLLGIAGGSGSPGAPAVQWDDNGSPDHLWQVVDAGKGYVKLVNESSGLPLDVAGASTASGAAALQNTDNGADSELWQLTPIS